MPFKPRGRLCSIEGCGKPHDWMGYCGMHAMRVKRYGNPYYVTPEAVRRVSSRDAQPTLGKLKPHVYPKFLGRHVHRRAAEEMLGRSLQKGEIVHHKDGNKHNNEFSNLQIMTQSDHINEHRPEMHASRMRKKQSHDSIAD